MARRTPQETKDVGVKRLIESYEKNNGTVCPAEKREQMVKMYEKEILPKVYGDKE